MPRQDIPKDQPSYQTLRGIIIKNNTPVYMTMLLH